MMHAIKTYEFEVTPNEPNNALPPLLRARRPDIDAAGHPESRSRIRRSSSEIDKQIVIAQLVKKDGVGRDRHPASVLFVNSFEPINVAQRDQT